MYLRKVDLKKLDSGQRLQTLDPFNPRRIDHDSPYLASYGISISSSQQQQYFPIS